MDNSVISQRIQDSFVYLAITDTKFLQIARQVVKPSYFSSQVTEDVVQHCYSYFDQFDEAPSNHLYDELFRFLAKKDAEEKDRYHTYLERVQAMDSPNVAYVIKRINDFVKAREFEEAAVSFVKKVETGDFVEAKELMHKALKAGIEREEVGLSYFDLTETPDYYLSMKEVLIPTGFPLIDKIIKGLRRGQFVSIFAGFKVGKTWGCVHFGKEGLLQGLNVLHVSHELSLDELEMRYDMSLGGLISEPIPEIVEFEEVDEKGEITNTWEKKVDTVYNFKTIQNVRRKIGKLGGKLILRKYPMGSCSMSEIDRYLDYLEMYEGFIPDILINDYVEKMKLPEASAHRDAIDRAYIEHKRIADERNILVITASQVNRGALGKFKLDQSDAAEDIRKIGNVDLALGMSQTKTQSEERRMTVYVMAGRSCSQGFGCIVSTNLKIGQLCTNCWKIPASGSSEDE